MRARRLMWLVVSLWVGLILGPACVSRATTVAWDASPTPTVTGYLLSYGYASRDYSVHMDVGQVTTASLSGLTEAPTYFLAVQAYDADGTMSLYSNEAHHDLTQLDRDQDGLKDWDELSVYLTNYEVADSDGDGLTDGSEVVTHHTDPLKTDSDGDGHSDGAEIAAGSNPLDPASIPGPTPTVFAVNAGGPSYTSPSGVAYQADAKFSGGSTYTTTAAISQTTDAPLYQSERFGVFSYRVPVANGTYRLTLRFAEIWFTQKNKRVFHVNVEGVRRISNLDLVAKVGANAAYDVSLPVTVSDGLMTIALVKKRSNPKVSAIDIVRIP